MKDLARIGDSERTLVAASRHVSRRGLQALGLVLSFRLAVECIRFGGVDGEKAFAGGLGAIVAIILIAALSDRR